jgi:hypothetical protein
VVAAAALSLHGVDPRRPRQVVSHNSIAQ